MEHALDYAIHRSRLARRLTCLVVENQQNPREGLATIELGANYDYSGDNP